MQTVLLVIAAILGGTPIVDSTVEPATQALSDTLSTAKVTSSKDSRTFSSAPIQKISAKQIELSGAIHLDEVLKTLPGVSVKDYGGIGGLKTVSIRNLGAQHTAVVYNGVLIYDAQNGQTDISRFSLSGIDEISVHTAVSDNMLLPAKAAAMAGIVSINTARKKVNMGEYPIDYSYSIGSFNTHQFNSNSVHRTNNIWEDRIAINAMYSDGSYPYSLQSGTQTMNLVRTNSHVSRLQAGLYSSGDLGKYGQLDFWIHAYESKRGLPGSVVLYADDRKDHLNEEESILNASYKLDSGNISLAASAGYRGSSSDYLDTNPALQEPRTDTYRQNETSANIILKYSPSGRISFALAEDLYFNGLKSNIFESKVSRFSNYTALRSRYAGRSLKANASLTYIFTEDNKGADQKTSSVIPELALSYKLPFSEDIHLRAFSKYGLRLPTFNDLYYSRVGNRNLKPEKAKQFGGGITWAHPFSSGDFSLTADAYHYLVEDKIVAIPTMFIWRMRNVGLVSMDGVDISAEASCSPADGFMLSARASYSYQYAIDITDPNAKNYRHQIAYTPRNSGSALLMIESPWINISYTLLACGERYSLAQNVAAYRMDPYADHSICISRDFKLRKSNVHLSFDALNLANHNYQIIQYYPMPGRNYRLTVKFSFT